MSSSKWCCDLPKRLLRLSAAMTTINLTHVFKLVAGDTFNPSPQPLFLLNSFSSPGKRHENTKHS